MIYHNSVHVNQNYDIRKLPQNRGGEIVFYDHFYELCKQAGVTPTQVARDLGIGQSTVSMWKKQGSTPRYSTLKKLANYFNSSVEDLLGFSDQRKEIIDAIENYFVEYEGEKRGVIRDQIIAEQVELLEIERFRKLACKADTALLNSFQSFPETLLTKILLDRYQHLNRLGRIEAVLRIDELAEDVYYMDVPDVIETPPEAPDGPPEAK